ncbi:Cyanovirin-N [Ceratobasidium sp. AG-I]|nr:Cyanovirin-N [Ceratobasidium sp. AG-I]
MQFTWRILALFATMFFFAASVLADGNFSSSCKDIKVSGTTLKANCKNSKKVYVAASVSLYKCLANYGGKLACAVNFDGRYSDSCSSCIFPPGTSQSYACICKPNKNTPSSIDLDKCIANYAGTLACAKQ